MTLSRQNIICGLCTITFGVLLFSQTLNPSEDEFTGGLQSMDYPRVLIYLLILLGGCIGLYPASTSSKKERYIPLLSKRTCSLGCCLILYAATFDVLGFAASSFCMACASGYIMGWRKIPLLILCNLCGISIIWGIFRFILKIPLPTGYFL